MKSELVFAAILTIEAVALLCASLLSRPTWLNQILILNMVLIVLFGEKLMRVFGLESNVGNVFYATACTAQWMIM